MGQQWRKRTPPVRRQHPGPPSWIPRRLVPDAALPPASMQASPRCNDNGRQKWLCHHSVGLFLTLDGLPTKTLYRHSGTNRNPTLAVIPAKAGIQWFTQAIPAQAGMTTQYPILPDLAQAGAACTPPTSRPALLDSGLRRNDNGAGLGKAASQKERQSRKALLFSFMTEAIVIKDHPKSAYSTSPSFQRKLESSG